MCGIAGWVAFGEERPSPGTVEKMLLSLEGRGRDATGLAYAPEWGCRAIGYCKHHLNATQFTSDSEVKKYIANAEKARLVILHTRAETKGTHKENGNNHPVMRKEGRYALVHNGTVDNDDAVFETCKIDREVQVDTEALVALMDQGESPQAAVQRLQLARGTYALAAMLQKKPDHLILVRRTSPLCYSYDPERDLLAFASTPETLSLTARVELFEKRGFKGRRAFLPREFPDDSVMIIGPEGIKGESKHVISNAAPLGGWARHLPFHGVMAGRNKSTDTATTRRPFGVSGAGGMITPVYVDKTREMRTFKFFPIANAEGADIGVCCPACWHRHPASAFRGHWKCPECKEALIPPTIFKVPTPDEVRLGEVDTH